MDFIIDILISKEDIGKVGFTEQFIKWGNEEFSHDPPQYQYGSKLIFESFIDLDYYKKYYKSFIGGEFNVDDFMAFRLMGSHMFELERLINYQHETIENLSNNEIFIFLKKLSEMDTFAVFLIRDEECIDKKCKLNNTLGLVDIIYNCISYPVSEGALIIKQI